MKEEKYGFEGKNLHDNKEELDERFKQS